MKKPNDTDILAMNVIFYAIFARDTIAQLRMNIMSLF